MAFNFRKLFFAVLFFCIANALFSQDDSDIPQYRMAFAWTKDDYALRYEVLFEKEENGEYNVVLREFTEEPFIFVSLPPGNYRSRVIPYDFRDIPGEGTEWKRFKVLAVIESGSESRLVMEDTPSPLPEQEEDTMPMESLTEDTDSILPELTAEETEGDIVSEETDSPPAKNRGFFIALLAEGSGYTRYNTAFGGGVTLGGSYNGKGLGISLLYAQDAEKFMFLEALAHFRYYLSFLSRAKINTGLFLQAEGGVVLCAYEKLEIAGYWVPVAGLSAGWRFPLGTRWFIEPAVRGGYPYIFGAGLSAGMRFDW